MNTNRAEAVLHSFRNNEFFLKQRISSGIEENRKGTIPLTVTYADGRPARHAALEFRQTRHAFRFGANLFMLEEMETDWKNLNYREKFAELFNYATLPFYWKSLEPEPGKTRYTINSPRVYRRPNPELCLKFCQENRIEPKAHCLVYEPWWRPDWLPDQDVPEVKRLYEKRMQELSERFCQQIQTWEVLNEALSPNCNTPIAQTPDFADWAFHAAEKFFPQNRLMINEMQQLVWLAYNGKRSPYYQQIQGLIERGARIDAIGIQYHMFHRREQEAAQTRYYYDPQHLYRVMDTFALLNRPLQITEVTIPAYSNAPEDEEVQAELLQTLYRIWFSHPAMEAIIYWNLADGYAVGGEPGDMTAGENYYYGGLLRFDGTPKPAYHTLKNLICNEWQSHGVTRTDEKGNASFRGFYGEYALAITVDEKTFTQPFSLHKNAETKQTIVLPF